MRFLSFDVANKSLAVTIIDCNHDDILPQMQSLLTKFQERKKKIPETDLINSTNEVLQKINHLATSLIKIHYLKVVDLIPNKKVKETTSEERLSNLCNYLKNDLFSFIQINDLAPFKVLIEYQMSPNDKSRAMSHQLAAICAFHDWPIHYVKPGLKNKLYFRSLEETKCSYFHLKYKSNYIANKNHSKNILKRLLNVYGQEDKASSIKKAHMDDAADAVTMALAYYMSNSKVLR